MTRSELTGSRIRQRRLDQRIKQADLAQSVGISASYLNLIEHNRRRIGGKLLVTLADELQIDPNVLSEGGATRVVVGLKQLAEGADSDLELDRIDEFAGRFPGWASRLLDQQARITDLERIVSGLNDRLTHDPVLSEKMHEVLSTVSAIRSTASILMETPDIAADWRERFHKNIDAESRRLAETSAAMAAHFDRLGRSDSGFTSPLEAADAFFASVGYCVDAIEEEGAAAIATLLDAAPVALEPDVRELAARRLTDYASVAEAMPLHAFLSQARACQFEPDVLATQFSVDLASVFRRMAHLPAQADIPEIAFVECDGSGAFLFRRPAPGFPIPRFGTGCPLWPLFSTLARLNTPMREHLMTPDGKPYHAYALAQPSGGASFNTQPQIRAMMLLIAASDGTPDETSLTVGSSCRVCPQSDCAARREPSILHVS